MLKRFCRFLLKEEDIFPANMFYMGGYAITTDGKINDDISVELSIAGNLMVFIKGFIFFFHSNVSSVNIISDGILFEKYHRQYYVRFIKKNEKYHCQFIGIIPDDANIIYNLYERKNEHSHILEYRNFALCLKEEESKGMESPLENY